MDDRQSNNGVKTGAGSLNQTNEKEGPPAIAKTSEEIPPTSSGESSQSLFLKNGSSGETDDSGKGTLSSLDSQDADAEVRKIFETQSTVTEMEAETSATGSMEESSPHSEESCDVQALRAESSWRSKMSGPEPEPGTSESSGIKKRTTSYARNYRSSNLQTEPESSNDTDAFISLTKTKSDSKESQSHSDDDEWDLPFKFRRGEYETRVEGDTPGTLTTDDSEAGEVMSAQENASASSHRSTPTSEADFNDFDDGDPSDADTAHSSVSSNHSSPRGPRYEVDESSSSSVIFENLESSSSSSDDYLEDLDERPVSTTGPLEEEASNRGNDGGSSATTSTSKKTPGKKIPKRMLELPKVLLKPKPKHNWNAPKELLRREIGLRSKVQPQSAEIFRSKFYGCLFSAERLELMKKLDGHNGCVNCLNFNVSGSKLASGSDDLTIKIWNYAIGKCITSFLSGHKANVFQAKFMPFNGIDTVMVSCARDNQVRLTQLDSTGGVGSSKKLAQHRGPAHKLSISLDNPHVVLTCGEDGVVFNIDVREEKVERLVKVFEKGKKIALFSIHQNPFASHEFCVTGKDQYVRIYDTRSLRTPAVPEPLAGTSNSGDGGESSDAPSSSGTQSDKDVIPLKKFCPHHLVDSRAKTNVTAAVYNYNGNEIVASYNDENIYLFDATHSDGADCVKVYEGHRNNATVKGVNFFGDRSQFVVSGSDCGNIYIWDKETESIVNFFRGDENGVVNCLEGHPTAPILATSGLDDDVKIWIPSNEHPPKMSELASAVRKNLRSREDDLKNSDMEGHIMWALWSHLRQADRNRRQRGGEGSDSNESWWRDEDDDDDDDDLELASRGVECSIA